MKFDVKKITVRVLCLALALLMLYGVCACAFAVDASSSSFVASYTCDFEGNYISLPNSTKCTDSVLKMVDGKSILEQTIKNNGENQRIIVYNSESGDFSLKNGSTYVVTVRYKVVQIAGKSGETETTMLSLVRLDSGSGAMLGIKAMTDASYIPGDTTDWVTSSAFFKASIGEGDNYTSLAVNVVSSTCPDKATGLSSDKTVIQFDEITVTECNSTTNCIEFIGNGGEYSEPIAAQSGEAIALPTPTRELYEFKGWYSDIALTKKFTSSKMPSSQINKLYAKWGPTDEAIVITFKSNGGGEVEQLVGNAGDVLSLPTVTREGCHFSGWYDKALENRADYTVFPDEDVTVYAKWDIVPFVMNLELYDNSKGAATRCKVAGDDDNHYLHWSDEFNPSQSANTMYSQSLNHNGVYYTVIPGVEYTVSFKYKLLRGTLKLGPVYNASNLAWGSSRKEGVVKLVLDNVNKSSWKSVSYTFVADCDEDKNYLSFGVAGAGEAYFDDIVVYPKLSNATYNGYIVGFDTQGGPLCETQYVKLGDTVTLPTLDREGYRFVGWSYDKEGYEQLESETITVDSAYTLLYADWYKIPEQTETVTEPEPEPEPEPNEEPISDSAADEGFFLKNKLWIISGASAAVLIIVLITVLLSVKKKSKKDNKNTDADKDKIE